MMPKLSVVTPVYKAERILPELYRRLKSALEQITKDFEIIMVNDHSPEGDWSVIRGLAAADPRVKGIDLVRNFGQHVAIAAGLDIAEGERVVVMDCDLQDQPEEIPKLYEKAQEGYDVVWGRRHSRKDSLLTKWLSSAYDNVYEYFVDEKVDGTIANFSVISRKVVLAFRTMHEHSRSYGLQVRWLGFASASVDIDHARRHEGTSSYDFKRKLKLGIESIVSQSNKPLRLSVRFGFFMAALSVAALAVLIYRYFTFGVKAEGWTSVMVSIWFLSGLLFVNMGILGLYLGKVYDETKDRPLYLVEATTMDRDTKSD
jgi:dolichol-phosphate mannosyltransferase